MPSLGILNRKIKHFMNLLRICKPIKLLLLWDAFLQHNLNQRNHGLPTWQIWWHMFKISKGIDRGRTYYLQSIEHKLEVQSCSIALFYSFCVYVFMFYHNKNLFTFLVAHFIFLSMDFCGFILVFVINKNWPKCNHYICNYMQLLIICNYFYTFLQLFLVLVIFAIALQLICHYFSFHLSMWTTFNLVFIPKK